MTTAQDKTSEWGKVALGDVCTKIGSGATPRGGKDVYLDEGPYTLIRSQNVYNGGFHRDGLVFISESHADALQNVEVIEEDVLLNITGDSVARVCQVAPDVLPARFNQHVDRLFFPSLWRRVDAAADRAAAEATKTVFLTGLHRVAQAEFDAALPAIPCTAIHRPRAEARARRRFRNALWRSYPELFKVEDDDAVA